MPTIAGQRLGRLTCGNVADHTPGNNTGYPVPIPSFRARLATPGLMANLGEQGVMNMARIDLILFASFLVTTSLPLGITYTLLLAR
jgi:hypothetical protein